MRIIVDRTLCDGNGMCVGEAPEVFDLDEKSDLLILQEEPLEELRAQVENAERSCPKRAISIAS